MEPCWEYLGCTQTLCVMYGRSDVWCWDLEGTRCNNQAVACCRADHVGDKKEACARAHCIYFEVTAQLRQKPA